VNRERGRRVGESGSHISNGPTLHPLRAALAAGEFDRTGDHMYCTDTDLLRWEPKLFIEAAFVSQTLLISEGTFDGSLLRLGSSAWFDVTCIRPGHVALIRNGTTVARPILSIDEPTVATVGIADRHPRSAENVRVTVRTFAAQRRIASELLTRMAGIDPALGQRVLDPRVLRRPCVLGTLHQIYSALSAAAVSDDADLIVRAQLYARLYRKSLRGLVVEIDRDNDNVGDARRSVGFVRYVTT
jgi:hypothetical protein